MVFTRPRRAAHLEIEKTAQNVIVTDRDRDYVHVLNDRAATVLQECDGAHTCDEIAQIVSERTHVPYDRIAGEVAHLVASFADLALLERSSTLCGLERAAPPV